jgi:hypothetical protein
MGGGVAGRERLPPSRSLSRGCETNQERSAMVPDAIEQAKQRLTKSREGFG